MTKSIEDYRNIVKILKLQLLKVREQNSSISNQMGIISESETSTFTPKLNHYKQCKSPFAQKVVLFLQFAHRCELIGVSPQMIFRIADKKRDKKVSVNGMVQIMKRLKFKMTEEEMTRLFRIMTQGNSIFYEEYLQYLSAFQINSEKYPPHSSRSYIQQCLIKFGIESQKKYSNSNDLFKKINKDEDKPYFQFNDLVDFIRKENIQLKESQIVGIFLGLDIQSECQVEKSIFKRQMDKVYKLIENGAAIEKPVNTKFSNVKNRIQQQEKDDFKEDTETGVQAGNKKKPAPKRQEKKDNKLDKGNTKVIEGELKKKGLSVSKLIQKLLQNQDKSLICRSFSLGQIAKALKALKDDYPKKDMIKIFKILDKDGNGSTSTEQLVKLWMRSDEKRMGSTPQTLFKLLFRHLKQIQFPDPLLRFTNFGYKPTQVVKQSTLSEVFENLQLSKQEINVIQQSVNKGTTVEEFADLLKSQGKRKSSKVFKPMSKTDFDKLSSAMSKLSKDSQKAKFKKLKRLQDGDQNDDNAKVWETIFTDQWACYQYCLKTAKTLDNFWRDNEFGPTKSDPHGYRSIVGNQSQIPPGLPDEEDIQWLTFEQILMKNNDRTSKVKLMCEDLKSTDVIQGKLGNCWYVSALSIIANNDQYIKGKPLDICQKNPQHLTYGIHPTLFHCFENYGMYVFKYFKKFKPVYVVVDDLFPVETSTNDLIFAKSPDAGLQWVAFAEKSYSKLHHSYSNMISGDIAQGLSDLTNSLPIKQNLKSDNPQNIDKIRKLTKQKQLMGCSISAPKGAGVQQPVQLDGQRCGLFYGHAYSIIDYLEFKTSDKNQFNLMRVRNPWGHGQWALDWSDKPLDDNPEYQKLKKYQKDLNSYYQKRIQEAKRNKQQPPLPYQAKDDGQFLMNFNDWTAIFSNLFTGLTFSDDQKYIGQYIIDKWDSKMPSGLCKSKGASQKDQIDFVKNNHQYILDIKEQTDILMLAIQQDGRLYRGEKYPYKELVNAVIVLVFNLEKNQNSLEKFDKEKMTDPNNLKLQTRRDVDFWHKFKPGKYSVMPCKNKNQIKETQFEFRVYSDKPINIKKVSKGTNSFKPIGQVPKNLDRNAISSVLDFLKKQNPKI